MAGRVIFNPDSFERLEENGEATGFSFQLKLQYYRGITLSIIRDIKVKIDGEEIPRENIRLIVNGETFTLEQCRTVISPLYRWEFGEYATVEVLNDKKLGNGKHHLEVLEHIAPSYMPFPLMQNVETDFEM